MQYRIESQSVRKMQNNDVTYNVWGYVQCLYRVAKAKAPKYPGTTCPPKNISQRQNVQQEQLKTLNLNMPLWFLSDP